MSIPKSHYFSPTPSVASRPRTVRLRVTADESLELQTDRGVFGFRGVDLGTAVLLGGGPAPPPSGDVLDLGCGYGPIAVAVARRSPDAHVWAVDVNERAVELTALNAASAGLRNVMACLPAGVPPSTRFTAIYSNPPVRVGKAALHELLEQWLERLLPEGPAYLVVQRDLGADSLAAWLAAAGLPPARAKSEK